MSFGKEYYVRAKQAGQWVWLMKNEHFSHDRAFAHAFTEDRAIELVHRYRRYDAVCEEIDENVATALPPDNRR